MIPLIYLAGLAAVTLIASDVFDDRETPRARRLPPPSPPPPPPPSPKSIPRGINPILFRRSAREVAQELQTLFSEAYVIRTNNHPGLEVINPLKAQRLQDRLQQITTIVQSDRWAAEEYDIPEIRRFFHHSRLVSEGQNRLALANHLMETSSSRFVSLEDLLCSTLRTQINHYPQNSLDYLRHHFLGNIHNNLERLKPGSELDSAWDAAIQKLANEDGIIANPAVRSRLQAMPTWNLETLHRETTQILLENETNLSLDQIPSNVQGFIIPQENGLSLHQSVMRIDTYINLLFRIRYRAAELHDRLAQEAGMSQRVYNFSGDLGGVISSGDPLDDANYRTYALESMTEYFRDYNFGNALFHASPDSIFEGNTLYAALCTPELGTALDCTTGLPPLLHSQRAEDTVIDFESIYSQTQVRGALEIRLEQLPSVWKDWAQAIFFDSLGGRLNLWEFMQQNVRNVIFSQHLPVDSRLGIEMNGTINLLTRSIIMKAPHNSSIPNDRFLTTENIYSFITLAHETFHLYSQTHTSIHDAAYSRNSLLDERNAYLFESIILRQWMKLRQRHHPLSPMLQYAHSQYQQARLTALATNRVLGLAENDSEIHLDLRAISIERSPQLTDLYPSQLIEAYARRHGAARFDALVAQTVANTNIDDL